MDGFYQTRESRLGKAFSPENLDVLAKELDKFGLPIIPYDITIDEMNILLAYQGNMLAYLQENKEAVSSVLRKVEENYRKTYNDVYSKIESSSAGHKATTIKVIAEGNKDVVAIRNQILDIKDKLSALDARINALQEQNVSLRKIGSMKSIAIQHGLE